MPTRFTFTGRDGHLRLIDGATPPKYLQLPFVQMDFTADMARARPPDPIIGTADGSAYLPDPGYGVGFCQPVPVAFSCWMDDTTNSWKLRDALGNPDMDPIWMVGTQVWVTAKGQGGSIVHSNGEFVSTPSSFYDTQKNTINLECLWTQPNAGSAFGIKCRDVYFPPQDQQIQESSESVTFSIKGLVFGSIEYVGAFTTGTAS